MNKLHLVGRITRDIDVKQLKDNKSMARFTVAAQRKYKNAEGKYDSDFIPCVAYGSSADFVSKYFKKGDMIGITGHMQSGSYEGKNGKVYTLDCYVDEVEFVGGKSDKPKNDGGFNTNEGFETVEDISELPFN